MYLSVAEHPTQQPSQHGRGPGPGGQTGGPSQSEHALRSGPWPRPSAPRAFSNLREPLYTREPARVGSDRMGGANGPPGWPRPSRAGSARQSTPQLPPKTPRGHTALGWLQRAWSHGLHPLTECPELPGTTATKPRETGRAPPLRSTSAPSLALLQTMGTPEQPRPPGGGCRGRLTPPIVSTLAPGAKAYRWPRPLPSKPHPQGTGTKAKAPPELHTKDERPPPARARGLRPSRVPGRGPAVFPAAPCPAVASA